MSEKNHLFIDPGEMREIAAWIEAKKKLLSQEYGVRMYRAIGTYMSGETKRNFEEQHDPSGGKWEDHRPATTEKRRKGPKTVKTDKKDEEGNPVYKRRDNKILQDNGHLMGSIGYRLAQDGVIIGTVNGNLGTVLKYARAMQYGIPKIREIEVSVPDVNGRYYYRKMNVPWGPIPARPFVGINEKNLERIERIIEKYILLDREGGDG
jgi:phage gpG-like protein